MKIALAVTGKFGTWLRGQLPTPAQEPALGGLYVVTPLTSMTGNRYDKIILLPVQDMDLDIEHWIAEVLPTKLRAGGELIKL